MISTRREIIVATSSGMAVWLGDADVDVELAVAVVAVLEINEEDKTLGAEEVEELVTGIELKGISDEENWPYVEENSALEDGSGDDEAWESGSEADCVETESKSWTRRESQRTHRAGGCRVRGRQRGVHRRDNEHNGEK